MAYFGKLTLEMEILMVNLTLSIFYTTKTILLDHLSGFCRTNVLLLRSKQIPPEDSFIFQKDKNEENLQIDPPEN